MIVLSLLSVAILLTVFTVFGFIGWHISPKPKARNQSLYAHMPAPEVDETLDAPLSVAKRPVTRLMADLAPTPTPLTDPVADIDPMVAAAQSFESGHEPNATNIIPMPLAPVVETVATPKINQAADLLVDADRSDRLKFSALATMTPETVEAVVEKAGSGLEPHRLMTPEGRPDDLKIISGIGPRNEKELNDLGIYHYWQIASWTPEHVAWLYSRMSFPKRIVRENWMAQAARMATRAA
jgi:predicted flap endonuclease-1-like 5' DNA nuclease